MTTVTSQYFNQLI